MNDKTQPSTRKDGFGTAGIGEGGDGEMGTTGTAGGGTGGSQSGGSQRGGHKVEGAFGEQDGSVGRKNESNKQGIPE